MAFFSLKDGEQAFLAGVQDREAPQDRQRGADRARALGFLENGVLWESGRNAWTRAAQKNLRPVEPGCEAGSGSVNPAR